MHVQAVGPRRRMATCTVWARKPRYQQRLLTTGQAKTTAYQLASAQPGKSNQNVSSMTKSRGFTMIELMVVIAIVAILTTLAAPSFVQLITKNNVSSAVNTFLADMRFARSDAVRRGGGVVMCRSDNPETTSTSGPTCGSGSTRGWESGWIIFRDQNNNGARNYNADPALDDTVLRVQAPITSINSIAEPGAATAFKFTATGRLNPSSITHLQFGSNPPFVTDAQRIVCVNQGGRARIALDSEGKPTGNASCSTDR